MTFRVLPVVAVVGRWPRSGTTLLVRMLDAGGATAIRPVDGPYATDWSDPNVLHDPVGSLGGLANGLWSVKVWPSQIRLLLAARMRPVAAISPTRTWSESAESWADLGWVDPIGDQGAVFTQWTGAVELLRAAGAPLLEVDFHSVIDNPSAESARIAGLVGGLDSRAMAAIPDRLMRHHDTRGAAS